MTCSDWRAAYLSGETATGDHGRTCASCRTAIPDLDQLRSELADPATWDEPDPAMEDLMVGLIGAGARRRAPSQRWLCGIAAVVVAAALVTGGWLALRASPPDWEIALPGTAAAPGADGIARGWNTEAGTRVVLDVDGLPPAPEGYVYELWFSRGPVHVSGGTFKEPANADLTIGVSRADFPRVWVTLEAIDEDESLSGETVLDTER